MGAEFGMRLRAQRERQGLTLDDVAASTKIKTSLLSALERSDLGRWPKGIYGRAFLRAYADAIGLPVESLDDVLPHVRTPEEVAASGVEADSPPPPVASMRLTFDTQVVTTRHMLSHGVDAAITLAGVLLAAVAVATAAEVSFLTAAAVVALVWYPISHAAFGGFSPTRLLTKHRRAGSLYAADESGAGGQAFADYQVTN